MIDEDRSARHVAAVREKLASLGRLGAAVLEDVSPPWLPQTRIVKVLSPSRFNEWGRGYTIELATLGGIMERVERVSAYEANALVPVTRFGKKDAPLPVLDLDDLGLCNFQRLSVDTRAEDSGLNTYVKVFRLCNTQEYFAPASRVLLGHRQGLPDFSCSTGLAAHFDRGEAQSRAVMEVLERHFHHLVALNGPTRALTIDLDSVVDERLAGLLAGLEVSGFAVEAFYVDIFEKLFSVVTFLSHESDDKRLSKHSRFHCAVHRSLSVAIERALTESIVSRGMSSWVPNARPCKSEQLSTLPKIERVGDLDAAAWGQESCNSTDIDTLQQITRKFGANIYLADLTHPTLQIPVFRAIIPGLQPNFDLMGYRVNDFRSRVTPHLRCYNEVVENAKAGNFAQQNVAHLVEPVSGSKKTSTKHSGSIPPVIIRFAGESIELPKPTATISGLALAILRRETHRSLSEPISKQELANIVSTSIGFKGFCFNQEWGFTVRRHYPSAGGRHPLEFFIEAQRVSGLEPGFYHYNAIANALSFVGTIKTEWSNPTFRGKPSAILYIMSIPERAEVKYGREYYRFCCLEAGHVAQNMLLICHEAEISATPLGVDLEERLTSSVRLPSSMEFMYALAFGKPKCRTNKHMER